MLTGNALPHTPAAVLNATATVLYTVGALALVTWPNLVAFIIFV